MTLAPAVTEEGWRQLRAGLELIIWSKLASWDQIALRLVPANGDHFEFHASGWRERGERGRVICWITFGVGAEYLAKGVVMAKGHDLTRQEGVIRIPLPAENIDEWVQLVVSKHPSIQ